MNDLELQDEISSLIELYFENIFPEISNLYQNKFSNIEWSNRVEEAVMMDIPMFQNIMNDSMKQFESKFRQKFYEYVNANGKISKS
jgi:hypothetical protein